MLASGIAVVDPKINSVGYVQRYSFEVKRQAPAGFVLTVGARDHIRSKALLGLIEVPFANAPFIGSRNWLPLYSTPHVGSRIGAKT